MNRPTTCAVHSEELVRLDQTIKQEFPVINELIGGVTGLLMCADMGSLRLNQIVDSRSAFYDNLAEGSYTVMDAIADSDAMQNGNYELPSSLDGEFMSWGFYNFLLQVTDAYRGLLLDEMASTMQKYKNQSIAVVCITPAPVKGVYLIQLDPGQHENSR